MLLALLVAAAVSAAPTPKTISLALPRLNGVNLAAGEADLQAQRLAEKFSVYGIKVLTARDVEAVLGMERQRQLMGCSDDSACLTEIAGALGVDGILLADLGRIDDGVVLNLKVIDPGTSIARAQFTESTDKAQLEALFDRGVRSIASKLGVAVVEPTHASLKPWALVPGILGVIALGTGVALQVVAENDFVTLNGGGFTPNDAQALQSAGRTAETASNALLISGGVLVVTSIILAVALPGAPVQPSVALSPNGGSIGLTGVFP